REIFEETGIQVDILTNFRETVRYNPKEGAEKEVVFFLAKAKTNKIKRQLAEVEDFAWLEFNDAVQKLTFENSKNILKKAYSHLITAEDT
ncbi:MAG: NUDIX domain-containing protein, partial [Nanoarchaeota archaeon]